MNHRIRRISKGFTLWVFAMALTGFVLTDRAEALPSGFDGHYGGCINAYESDSMGRENCCYAVLQACNARCQDGDSWQLPSACMDDCINMWGTCLVTEKPNSTANAVPPSLWIENFLPEVHYKRKLTGDFNGDGFDDLIIFVNTAFSDERRGDTWVALSNGRDGFEPPQLWRGWFCAYSSQICEVGDFDGDGMDDVFVLTRGDGAGRGHVGIARSLGNTFVLSTPYKGEYGKDWQDLEVADMNGDGLDDAVLYRKGSGAYVGDGDVAVMLSNGVDDLAPYTTGGWFKGCQLTAEGCDQPIVAHPIWHDDFCYDGEECFAGDLDGDGAADLVTVRPNEGDVLYTPCGYSWGSSRYVCFDVPSPLPFPLFSWAAYELSDVDGDGQADLVSFNSDESVTFATRFERDTSSGSPVLTLDTYDAPFYCTETEPQGCRVADVNGDRQADLVQFTIFANGPAEPGDAWVNPAPFADQDEDLVPTDVDNCPMVANPDQADTDGDGIGDVCTTACNDGIDNDGDGLADADDPGCVSGDDLSERTPLAGCDDGEDNDGDGLIDYPADPQCSGPGGQNEARVPKSACGMGIELAAILPALIGLRARRRR